ncbi:hypothetical protein [Actinomadura meridiana]
MAEFLYSCEEPPTASELMYSSGDVLDRELTARLRSHGYDLNDASKRQNRPSFERYWFGFHSTPGPEEYVIERVAALQIVERLSDLDRSVLAAMANFADNGIAANSLGKRRQLFTSQLGDARRNFKVLWHEGEKPSRPWMLDRRRKGGPDRPIATVIRRRKRDGVNTRPRPVRKGGKPRKEIGITPEDLRQRYAAGESISEIARSLNIGATTLRRFMEANGIPRRSYVEAARVVADRTTRST